MVIKPICENGVFTPLERVPLEAETDVEVYSRAEQGRTVESREEIRAM
jgi:predicted DNA-binding antitoxin AbrB/MazE fold protein